MKTGSADKFGIEVRELIEAINRLTKAIDSISEPVKILNPDWLTYTCGTCGEKGKDGVDFGVGGFVCDECYTKEIEIKSQKRTAVDPGKTSSEKRGA